MFVKIINSLNNDPIIFSEYNDICFAVILFYFCTRVNYSISRLESCAFLTGKSKIECKIREIAYRNIRTVNGIIL